MQWYALYTPGGTEEKVVEILKKQMSNFKFVIYKRRLRERKEGQWHMVERKMFPGYVLMKGVMTEVEWHQMRSTDASFRLLKNNDEYLTLTEEEVKMLELLDGDEDGLVDISEIYVEGERVTVTRGALMGQEARIVKVNKRKGRAKVRIDFCGSERVIELGVELIQKMD